MTVACQQLVANLSAASLRSLETVSSQDTMPSCSQAYQQELICLTRFLTDEGSRQTRNKFWCQGRMETNLVSRRQHHPACWSAASVLTAPTLQLAPVIVVSMFGTGTVRAYLRSLEHQASHLFTAARPWRLLQVRQLLGMWSAQSSGRTLRSSAGFLGIRAPS